MMLKSEATEFSEDHRKRSLESLDRLFQRVQEARIEAETACFRYHQLKERLEGVLDGLLVPACGDAQEGAEHTPSEDMAFAAHEDTEQATNSAATVPDTQTAGVQYGPNILAALDESQIGFMSYRDLRDHLSTGPLGPRLSRTSKGLYSALAQLAREGEIIRCDRYAVRPWAREAFDRWHKQADQLQGSQPEPDGARSDNAAPPALPPDRSEMGDTVAAQRSVLQFRSVAGSNGRP